MTRNLNKKKTKKLIATIRHGNYIPHASRKSLKSSCLFLLNIGFIDITSRTFRTTWRNIMSKELVAFLDLAKEKSDQSYNAMRIIDKLGKDVLSHRAYKTLKNKYKLGELFFRIPMKAMCYCSFSRVVHAFY